MIRTITVEREYGAGGGAIAANWPSGWAGSFGIRS